MHLAGAQHQGLDPVFVHPSGVDYRVFCGDPELINDMRQQMKLWPNIPQLKAAPITVGLMEQEVLLLPEAANLNSLFHLRLGEPHTAAAALM